ncbi:MAG: hypothetical protein LBL69_06310, partial [Zoogloeaceae bacterium]|nr:hypothetical protein [Zoogloeaceae bacterium]
TGQTPPRQFSGGLSDGMLELNRLNPALARPGSQQAVDQAEQKIRAGWKVFGEREEEKILHGLHDYPANVLPEGEGLK